MRRHSAKTLILLVLLASAARGDITSGSGSTRATTPWANSSRVRLPLTVQGLAECQTGLTGVTISRWRGCMDSICTPLDFIRNACRRRFELGYPCLR